MDLFLAVGSSFSSTVSFTPLWSSDQVFVAVFTDFLSSSKGDSPFHRVGFKYSCANWPGLSIIKDLLWEESGSFNQVASSTRSVESGFR